MKRVAIKALTGRGRKRPEWKNILHESPREEFLRWRSAGVKVNRNFLIQAALALVEDENIPVTAEEIETYSGKNVAELITVKWIDDFCDRYNIVTRMRTGNKLLSSQEIAKKHRFLAYHLGVVKRKYDDGLDPSTVENYDETHMIIDMDNGRV